MAFAQSVYLPYSYQFYQKFNTDIYSTQTRTHSALKPYFADDSLLKHRYDSLMRTGIPAPGKSWISRKLFNEHLIQSQGATGNSIYFDVLPEFQAGRDFSATDRKSVWTTALGMQIGGTISPQFSFYGSLYFNRAALPSYILDNINNSGYIPGQGADRSQGDLIKNWYYSSFLLSYTPVKYINITLGKDKTFIGDGYRSMLLSDFASNYPFLKLTGTLGNVKYMTMYAYLNNPFNPALPYGNTSHKWGYFQYLDWSVSNRISLGFFQNVMEATRGTNGTHQGFNPSLASPVVFLVPLDNIDNNPGKNVLGFTGKYKVFDGAILYGQFILNEFHAKDFFSGNGSVTNKSGYQLGFRGTNLFRVTGLNYLAEFNTARPYTYSSFDQTSNYSQDGQPLANPFGANFREWVGILNYSLGRFDFQGQLNYAYYGLDSDGLNYGQNIFKSYNTAAKQYDNYVGQGIKTDFYYAEGKIAYLVNPRYNLRLEVGAIYRDEKNSLYNNKTTMLTIGLRSSFRNIYHDF